MTIDQPGRRSALRHVEQDEIAEILIALQDRYVIALAMDDHCTRRRLKRLIYAIKSSDGMLIIEDD